MTHEELKAMAEVSYKYLQEDLDKYAARVATDIAQPVIRSMWSSSRGAQRDLLRDMIINGANWMLDKINAAYAIRHSSAPKDGGE